MGNCASSTLLAHRVLVASSAAPHGAGRQGRLAGVIRFGRHVRSSRSDTAFLSRRTSLELAFAAAIRSGAERILSVATFCPAIRACVPVHAAPDCVGPRKFSADAAWCSAFGDRRSDPRAWSGVGREVFSIVRRAIPVVAAPWRNGVADCPAVAAVSGNTALAAAANAVVLRSTGAASRTTAARRRDVAASGRMGAIRGATVRARGQGIRAR